MLEAYIQQLAIDLDILDDINDDELDCYTIPIEEGIFVTVQELRPGFNLFATFTMFPQIENTEILSTALMNANLLGRGTGNALIGLDENGKYLTLSQTITYEVNYHEFRDTLEDFVNTIDYWNGLVIEFSKTGNITLEVE